MLLLGTSLCLVFHTWTCSVNPDLSVQVSKKKSAEENISNFLSVSLTLSLSLSLSLTPSLSVSLSLCLTKKDQDKNVLFMISLTLKADQNIFVKRIQS